AAAHEEALYRAPLEIALVTVDPTGAGVVGMAEGRAEGQLLDHGQIRQQRDVQLTGDLLDSNRASGRRRSDDSLDVLRSQVRIRTIVVGVAAKIREQRRAQITGGERDHRSLQRPLDVRLTEVLGAVRGSGHVRLAGSRDIGAAGQPEWVEP